MARRSRLFFDIAAEDKSGAAFSSLQNRLKTSEDRLRSMRRQFAVAAAAAAAFGASIVAAAVRSGNQIDAQSKLARVLNTTTESVQVLTRASELSGVAFGEVEAGATRLSRRLSLAAQGAGPAAGVFRRLGFSISELQAMPLDERITSINDAISEMIPEAERAAVASKIFGDRGFQAFQKLNSDNIRKAADEIARMGLAVSDFDASRIEQANDQISSLRLVVQAFGNQLASQIVPTLGRFAEKITRAFEAGRPLRNILDAITNNITTLSFAVAGAVTFLGVRLVAAFVLVRAQTIAATVALNGFRTALLRTGFGAVAIALGSLAGALFATELGFDNNTRALGDEERALRANIAALSSGQTMSRNMAQQKIAEIRTRRENIAAITDENRALMNSARIEASNAERSIALAEAGARPGAAGAFETMTGERGVDRLEIERQRTRMENARARVLELASAIDQARGSTGDAEKTIAALEKAIAEAAGEVVTLGDEFDNIVGPTKRIERTFEGVTNAVGGASGRMKDSIESVGDAFEATADTFKATGDQFGDMVADIVLGSRKIGDVLRDLGSQLLRSGISGIVSNVFGGGSGGGGGKGLLGLGGFLGFLDGGGRIGAGQFAVAGERGPEIITGPANVTSRVDTARMLAGGGQPARVEVVARVENGNIIQTVRQVAGDVAVKVMGEGLTQFERNTLPESVKRINADPRRRG